MKPAQRDWVPTVPATPIATTPKPPNGRNGANSFQGSNVLMSPVPIIAPPEDHMPKFPLNAETLAKMRLMRYLEREASGREIDGLPAGLCQRPPPWMVKANIAEGVSLGHESTWDDNVVGEWEIVLGVGRKRREAAINWLLDVRSTVHFICCFLMPERNRYCLSKPQAVHRALKVCPRMPLRTGVVLLAATIPRPPHLHSTQRILLMLLLVARGQYTICKISSKTLLKHDFMRLGCFSDISTSLWLQFPKVALKIALYKCRGRFREQILWIKRDWA